MLNKKIRNLKEIKKIKEIKKTKKFLSNIPLNIAKHAFLSSLVIILLSLILGALLFYKYTVLAEKAGNEDLGQKHLLEEKLYQRVLDVWQEREKTFQQASIKDYPNPFSENN